MDILLLKFTPLWVEDGKDFLYRYDTCFPLSLQLITSPTAMYFFQAFLPLFLLFPINRIAFCEVLCTALAEDILPLCHVHCLACAFTAPC